MVIKTIQQECHAAMFYSLSADETKDISKKEVLTVTLRYYCDESKSIVENFIGFTHLEDLGAASITESILAKIENEAELSLANCISVTFDGASTMSGRISGVQARLKERNPLIVCIHIVLIMC